MATVEQVELISEDRVVLTNISWKQYEELRAADETAWIRGFRAWVRERLSTS